MKYIHVYTRFEDYSSAIKTYPDISLIQDLSELVIFNHDYNEYAHKYLTFEILTSGTIVWKGIGSGSLKTIQYKLNDGEWTSITATTSGVSINVSENDIIRFKGTNAAYSKDKSNYSAFYEGTATYNAYGNAMSLIYGDEYENKTKFTAGWALANLFNHSNLVSAINLVLPAPTLTEDCYRAMFANSPLFTEAPQLPATTLADSCYKYMFDNCILLTKAPDLLAPVLTANCYYGIFHGCTNLNYIKCLATDISATDCTKQWIGDVSAGHVADSGTFIKDLNMNDWVIETEWTNALKGIPPGWTVIDDQTLYNPKIYCDGDTIEITCQTIGAEIYYDLNNSGTFTKYTQPIDINANTFVEAYATYNGETSDTVNKSCVYVYENKYERSNKSIGTWTYDNQEVQTPYSINAINGHSSNYSKGTFNLYASVYLKKVQPTYLWFQHADQSASIYVDDVLVEKHWGGYTAFFVDITNYIHAGTNNIKVALKNNEGNNLAPASADFNFNATLGNVKLFTSPVLPAMKYGYDGFHVTSTVSNASATINVMTTIPVGASVTCTIMYGETQVYTSTANSTGEEQTFTTTIQNPHLWNGTAEPNLYDITLNIYKNGELYHSFTRPYGLRYYEYVFNETFNGEPYTGFLLNGQPYLLRGCCMHDDIDGKANALNDADYAQTFATIQELGLNFLRLAHYPHPKEVYDWCDRLGIIVQTEGPCVNKMQSTMPEQYFTHLEGQYTDMVNQHFNHPCILFWGLSNETSTDDKEFAKGKIEGYISLIKNIDTERWVGLVLNQSNGTDPFRYYNNPTGLDWVGCNIYVGWYASTSSNNPTSDLTNRINKSINDANIHKPIAYSEYGCGGTQNCHSETPSTTTNKGSGGARHDIEYHMWLHEGHITAIKNKPELLFTAQWQLFDVAVSSRNEGYTICLDGETTSIDDNLRYLNDKGLVERDHVTKKDTFYLYKAWWSSQIFVHICGKDYEKNKNRVIKCYTNAGDSLDLYVNGTFIETATVTNNICTFTAANYESGDIIRVEGDNNTYDSYEFYTSIISTKYLKFTAQETNSTIKLQRYGSDTNNLPNAILQYSTDGSTWNNYTLNTDITLTNIGDYVMFKGYNSSGLGYNYDNYHQFIMSGTISASGDITSLLNEVGGDVSLYGKSYCFYNMFWDCTSLTTAPELPTTTLSQYCYASMFRNCTSLTTAPALPATTLTYDCYESMFYGCTSLTTAPALPATTLAASCYSRMFYGCTSLTTTSSILPATTLANYCYYSMFDGCTSLTTAPELPATTLAYNCYDSMFWGCTKLTYIKAMFTTTPSYNYTTSWVTGVSSTGTFVKNSSATWNVTGVNGVPSGWTVETVAA